MDLCDVSGSFCRAPHRFGHGIVARISILLPTGTSSLASANCSIVKPASHAGATNCYSTTMSFPDSTGYIDIAIGLAEKVAGRVEEIDEGRRIPADLAAEMADAGLFRLLVPKSLGGGEIPHPELLEIVRIFARVDASTAWCVNQNNITATDSVRMPVETAREIWNDQRAAITNGPPSRNTIAVPVEGGYRVTGHWDFSSGSSHGTWLVARGPVDGRPGEIRTSLVPKGDVPMVDTWDVSGLRGTASLSFDLDDHFVPENHTYVDSMATYENGPLYVTPKVPMYSIGFAALAVELARACLDDAIGVATKKSQHGVSSPMIDRPTVHRQIGENEVILRAADSYLRSTASKMWDAAVNRGEVDLAIRAEIRMASTYAIRQAVQVVDAAYEICGAGAIFKRNPVQRRYQDIHVIVQQFQGRPTNFETAGRYYLGLDTIGSL